MAQFTNQAQISYNNEVRNSNIAVGEIQEALSATQSVVNAGYGAGEGAVYALSIVNSGETAFNGLTVTSNLGSYTAASGELVPLSYVDDSLRYYVNGQQQMTPVVTAGDTLTVSNLSVPANSEAMLLYGTRTNQFAPLAEGSRINNEVTIEGTGLTDVVTTTSLEVTEEPDLSILKSVSPVPVLENGILTYTFAIQNVGNKAADTEDNVVITDVLNPVLSNVSASLNGAVLTLGEDYTYDTTTGTFATIAGRVTVPVAEFTQNEESGAWTVTPGISTLVLSGTVTG